MSPSATLATQSGAAPRPEPTQSPSATPATQNEGGCRQVPRLPRSSVDGLRKMVCDKVV